MNKAFPRKLLFCVLALSLLASCGKGCKKGGESGAQADPLDLVPAGNNLLISLNIKKLMNTPFSAEMMKDAPAEIKEISKDVNEALIALNVRGPSQPPSGLAIVNGTFDEKKIISSLEALAKKEGQELKKEPLETKTVYLSPKDPNIGLILFSPTQIVWGQMADLKAALALAGKKGDSIRNNKELMDLFNKRDSKKLLWGAGLIPASATPPPSQPGDPMAALQGLKAFSLGIDYDKDLTIDLTAQAQDAAQAQNLTNLVNSYKTIFGASLAAQQPMWGQVIQGAQIGNQDKLVTISLKLNEEVVKQLSQMAAAKKDKGPEAPPAPSAMPGAGAGLDTPPAVPQPPAQAAQPQPPPAN